MPAKIKRFLRLSKSERRLFFSACLLCTKYSIKTILISTSRVMRGLGDRGVESGLHIDDEQLHIVMNVKRAFRRANKYLPWKTKCLPNAIASRVLLKKYEIKSTIYIGVSKDNKGKMTAHAWIRCGNVIVTGKEEMARFVPMVCFS